MKCPEKMPRPVLLCAMPEHQHAHECIRRVEDEHRLHHCKCGHHWHEDTLRTYEAAQAAWLRGRERERDPQGALW